MKAQSVHILTLLVDNEFGVLTRITGQIRREGWNIKSLAVAETTDETISRLTLALECFDAKLKDVIQRLSRLDCVRSVTAYKPEEHLCRELLLARVSVLRESVEELINKYEARVISSEGDSFVIELTAERSKVDNFLLELQKFGSVQAARTGAITLER
ncbi:MAG TPA: acetolactate synthase small subunit [Clostridia bacterium]|nr:acetolactate synthase small subunit [Clostridia bacterium]